MFAQVVAFDKSLIKRGSLVRICREGGDKPFSHEGVIVNITDTQIKIACPKEYSNEVEYHEWQVHGFMPSHHDPLTLYIGTDTKWVKGSEMK